MDFATAESTDSNNPIALDLMLDETGDFAFVTGKDARAQHLRSRFRMWRGESFADQRLGFPWREEVLRKGVDMVRIRSLVTRTIETTPGIAELNELRLEHERARRRLTIHFRAKTTDAEAIDSSDYAPFLLEAV